jgi:cell shape-determining protein MreC
MITTRSERLQNIYLKTILEEIKALSGQIKKLEAEIKDLKKHTTNHQHPVVISPTKPAP